MMTTTLKTARSVRLVHWPISKSHDLQMTVMATLVSEGQAHGRLFEALDVSGAKGGVVCHCNTVVYFKSELSVPFRLIYIASRLLIGKQVSGKVRRTAAVGGSV